MQYLIPVLFILVFVFAFIKKVKPYDTFVDGVKSAVPFAVSIFPYLVSIFVLTELFELSGLSSLIADFLSPAFNFLGIPKELTKLVLIKPFSPEGDPRQAGGQQIPGGLLPGAGDPGPGRGAHAL